MINSNFGFTPLEEVWLGDCYPESYYDHLPNEIADPFRQITEWTKADTGKLQQFLESRGIRVRRPQFSKIDDYLNSHGNLVKPPICPRDNYLVLGSTLYSLHNELATDPWQSWLDHYRSCGNHVEQPRNQAINCVYPPAVVRIGRDLYIDTDSHQHVWGHVSEWMVELAKTYRVNICSTDGHSDGVFCPVGPGMIVSTHYKTNYSQSFPGWEVFHVPEHFHNYNNSKNWLIYDNKIDSNKAFADHLIKNASNWVGNFIETVPEVNMLVLDEKNIVAMKEYPPLTRWLEQRGITVHFFDFRTRSFWDGGWHCLTLDISRKDNKLDLFPDRGSNGLYWRLQ